MLFRSAEKAPRVARVSRTGFCAGLSLRLCMHTGRIRKEKENKTSDRTAGVKKSGMDLNPVGSAKMLMVIVNWHPFQLPEKRKMKNRLGFFTNSNVITS